MNWELGLTRVYWMHADAALRLWKKQPQLKTWLEVLCQKDNANFTVGNGARSWVTNTPREYKVRLTNYAKIKDSISKPINKLVKQCDEVRRKGKIPTVDRVDRDELRECLIKTDFYYTQTEKQNQCKSTIKYINADVGGSRNFINQAIFLPHIAVGTHWLVRLRTNSWWSSNRRKMTLDGQGKDSKRLTFNECLFCRKRTDLIGELAHILVECPRWEEVRKRTINLDIKDLYNALMEELPNAEAGNEVENDRETFPKVASYLIGGRGKALDLASCAYENDELRTYNGKGKKLTKGSHRLSMYYASWGWRADRYMYGRTSHGYVPVSEFLQEVMPLHSRGIFLEDKDPAPLPKGVQRLTTDELSDEAPSGAESEGFIGMRFQAGNNPFDEH